MNDAEQKQTITEMSADLDIVDTLLDTWKAENKQLQAENTRLREALFKYGSHTPECGIIVDKTTIGGLTTENGKPTRFQADFKCNCGYSRALKGVSDE